MGFNKRQSPSSMSRRKQSNPKPLKRLPDEETENGIPEEETNDSVDNHCKFPAHTYLQTREDGDVVCCSIPIPKGFSFGSYNAAVSDNTTDLESSRDPVEFHHPGGKKMTVLTEKAGDWLKLLKRDREKNANSIVYYDGKKIVCQSVTYIPKDSEMVASFALLPNGQSDPFTPCSDVDCVCSAVKVEPEDGTNSAESSPSVKTYPLIYQCPFCKVRFSSGSTLEAHLTYYCSKTPPGRINPATDSPTSPSPGQLPQGAAVMPDDEQATEDATTKKNLSSSLGSDVSDNGIFDLMSPARQELLRRIRTASSNDVRIWNNGERLKFMSSTPSPPNKDMCWSRKVQESALQMQSGFKHMIDRDRNHTLNRASPERNGIASRKSSSSSSDFVEDSLKLVSSNAEGHVQTKRAEWRIKHEPILLSDYAGPDCVDRYPHLTKLMSPKNNRFDVGQVSAKLRQRSFSSSYCRHCSIRFSSYSTYKAHKQFYCGRKSSIRGHENDDVLSSDETSELKENEVHLEASIINGYESQNEIKPKLKQTSPLDQQLLSERFDEGSLKIQLPTTHMATENIDSTRHAYSHSLRQTLSVHKAPANISAPAHSSIMPGVWGGNGSDSVSPHSIGHALSPASSVGSGRVIISSEIDDDHAHDGPLDLSTNKAKQNRDSSHNDEGQSTSKRAPSSSSSASVSPAGRIEDTDNAHTYHMREDKGASALSPNRIPVNDMGRSHTAKQSTPSHRNVYSFSRPTDATDSITTEPLILLNLSRTESAHSNRDSYQISQVTRHPHVGHQVSRCLECNIVFYKQENFQIHKKYYCASRRVVNPISGTTAHLPHPIERQLHIPLDELHSEQTALPSTCTRDHPVNRDSGLPLCNLTFMKYYCVPCDIKFSSEITLNAHRTHYCPHREDDESGDRSLTSENGQLEINIGSSILHSSEEAAREDERSEQGIDETISQPSMSIFPCHKCDREYPSPHLLSIHCCSESPASEPTYQMAVLCCPYCDVVTSTKIKMLDHLKAHSSSMGFKCLLCGYRGNTIRGMRMHGKVHTEHADGFTEEHVLEYHIPPMLPASTSSERLPASIKLDTDTELMRMKSEPYKRRRSRKSYEKAEHRMYAPPVKLMRDASPVRETGSATTSPNHEQDNDDASPLMHTYSFGHDNFQSREKQLQNMLTIHPEHRSLSRVNRTKSASPIDHSKQITDRENTADKTQLTVRSSPAELCIKVEPDDREYDRVEHAEKCTARRNSMSPSNSDHQSNIVSIKVETVDVCRDTVSEPSTTPIHSRIADQPEMDQDPDQDPHNSSPPIPEASNSDSHPVASYPIKLTIHPLDSKPILNTDDTIAPDSKYCTFCDINFTYLSSFIAHKRYYCNGEKWPSSSPPSIRPPVVIYHGSVSRPVFN